MPPILSLRNIHLTFGGDPLLKGADLSISKGDKTCLIGRNGSGKSTLLKVAAGLVEPDEGKRFIQPGVKISYLPQEQDFYGYKTVLDYIIADIAIDDSREKVNMLINYFGLTANKNLSILSGGEARRCALARSLAPNPDVLLLDEPTNHLDLPIIEWLEKEILNKNSAIVVISHDRKFLENISNSIIWINNSITYKLNKKFNQFEEWKENFIENEIVNKSKLDKKILMENQWLHKGVTARRKRNMGRLNALKNLRIKRKNEKPILTKIDVELNESENTGKKVSYVKNISKSYNGVNIINNFSTIIQRGDRLGIVGSNGVGKTTLLNILIGLTKPDEGVVFLGKKLEIEILDQKRDGLDLNMTLANAISRGGDHVFFNGESQHIIGYMKSFLFAPEQARTPVNVLSGGEKSRVVLARSLAKPSNVLILDEPTNDLDLETLDFLQEILSDYKGTIILVSHDRDFIDRIVTSTIAYEGNGKWIEYAGGYSDMIEQKFRKNDNEAKSNQKISKKRNKTKAQLLTRFTYKDKYQLSRLTNIIEELELEIKTQQKTLSDTDLFRLNPELFNMAADKLKIAESAHKKAEDNWLELEIKRESLI